MITNASGHSLINEDKRHAQKMTMASATLRDRVHTLLAERALLQLGAARADCETPA